MIEQFCRNIYNIGLQLKCNLSSNNCRCPDKDAYEFLCYQCYLGLKDILNEDYQLKFNGDSGEVIIFHDFKQENPCISADWTGHQIINVIVENVKDKIEESKKWDEKSRELVVELVALSLTQAAIRDIRIIPYSSIVNAFKVEQFVDFFWNLSVNILQRMRLGRDFSKLLNRMCQCINDINAIYDNRQRIGDQFYHYLDLICKGLEGTSHNLLMEQNFLYRQGEAIRKKQSANNLEDFLFCGMDTDGKIVESELKETFIKMCTIMKQYLISYQQQTQIIDSNIYQKFILLFSLFAVDGLDISFMDGLEKLKLQTANAWTANAGIVLRYLQKVRKENKILSYALTSV